MMFRRWDSYFVILLSFVKEIKQDYKIATSTIFNAIPLAKLHFIVGL
jgi:hypothetical protein